MQRMWEICSSHFKTKPCWLLSLKYNIPQLSIADSRVEVIVTASSLPIAGSTTRLPGIKANYRGNWPVTETSRWVFWAISFESHSHIALLKSRNSGFSGLHALSNKCKYFWLKWFVYYWLTMQVISLIIVIFMTRMFQQAYLLFIYPTARNLSWFDTECQINHTVIEVHQ